MVRSGFDPTRRNRNIGTPRQGHGGNNRLTIPSSSREERTWWERVKRPTIMDSEVLGRPVRFITEELRPGFRQVCTIKDVCRLLALIPMSDWTDLTTFVFRQPTRKQLLLQPTWGRLAMAANIGEHGKKDIYSGPAILLEALDLSVPLCWGRSLDHATAQELERLKADGHTVTEDRRGYTISSSVEAARATQLYRTIPHEIGHWVDWLERVERPSKKVEQGGADYAECYGDLVDGYWARASVEREAFAHLYADRLVARLKASGQIPFPSDTDSQANNCADESSAIRT